MTEPCRCAVPYCPRTTRTVDPEKMEWLCADHWKLVDRTLKFRAGVWKRRAANRPKPGVDYAQILSGLWIKAKRQAIERAVGITA